MTLIIFNIISAIVSDPETAAIIIDPIWLNDLVIFFIRIIAYTFWGFPIISVFWPGLISNQRREELQDNKNKRTIGGHTVPSGFFSQSISTYLDEDNETATTNTKQP